MESFKHQIVTSHAALESIRKELHSWFRKKGFKALEFGSENEFIQTSGTVVIKVSKRTGCDTYIKITKSSAVLVFECALRNDRLYFDCYAPIWLFGIWVIKLNFKSKAGVLFPYLEEGKKYSDAFERHFQTFKN